MSNTTNNVPVVSVRLNRGRLEQAKSAASGAGLSMGELLRAGLALALAQLENGTLATDEG